VHVRKLQIRNVKVGNDWQSVMVFPSSFTQMDFWLNSPRKLIDFLFSFFFLFQHCKSFDSLIPTKVLSVDDEQQKQLLSF
jgi:hypothetical protein